MKRCGLGYFTDVRYDNLGHVGIMEKHNFFFGYNTVNCKLVFCIDNNGNPAIPAYNDVDNGFVPLSTKIELTNDGLNKYLKSHKGCFNVLGSFLFITEANLKYDKNTKELLDSRINFYLPVQVMDSIQGHYDVRGYAVPVIITQRCGTKDSTYDRETNPKVVELYKNKVVEFLTYDRILSREDFMRARMNITD